jgi:hypothetical protein
VENNKKTLGQWIYTGIALSPRQESMIEMHIPENVKLWVYLIAIRMNGKWILLIKVTLS